MAETYEVKPGDCISSIAYERGFFWQTLWHHPDNAALKELRQTPNVLLSGDQVKIPEKTLKDTSISTEQRHRFKLKGVPAKLRLRLIDHEQAPRANVACQLSIDGRWISLQTNAQGQIEQSIPPNARQVILKFKTDDLPQEYELHLGGLDPTGESSGVLQRLANLGYAFDAGQVAVAEKTRAALAAFQEQSGLTVTGQADDATRQKLKELHGV